MSHQPQRRGETHERVLAIVENIGIEFRDAESLPPWRQAGAAVDGTLARLSGELLMGLLETLADIEPGGHFLDTRHTLADCPYLPQFQDDRTFERREEAGPRHYRRTRPPARQGVVGCL